MVADAFRLGKPSHRYHQDDQGGTSSECPCSFRSSSAQLCCQPRHRNFGIVCLVGQVEATRQNETEGEQLERVGREEGEK